MKLLVVTYSISKSCPAGQVFRAYLESLSNLKGVEIILVSCPDENINNSIKYDFVRNSFQMKERLHKVLFMLTGMALENLFWTCRVSKKLKSILSHNRIDYLVSFVNGNKPELIHITKRCSIKHKVPSYIHMVDPIPPPSHWGLNTHYWEKLRSYVEPGLLNAKLLSFGNKRMLDFQNSLFKSDIAKKSFVLPDAVSGSFKTHGSPSEGTKVFTYLGAFYGIRKPDNLLYGFSKFIKLGYDAELRIYGDSNIDIDSYGLSIEVKQNIRILPFTSDLDKVIKESHVLIDVDVPFNGNVFSSSKIKRYLFHDRQVLCITNNDSPSFDICRNLPKTSRVADHKIENITRALKYLYDTIYNRADFDEREAVINYFEANYVVKKIIIELKNYDTE